MFYRKGLLFAFNFHHSDSYVGVRVPVPNKADYTVALSSDDAKYGGFGQIEHMTYPVKEIDGKDVVELYLPARTAIVLVEGEIKTEKPKRTRKTAAKKAAAEGEEKPKRTRKTKAEKEAETAEKPKRTRKTKAEKEAEASAATEEKPKRKRTTKKAAETAETAEPAAEKPKRTRKTKKAEETAE